ncbi:MAG: hypothetical protein PVF90_00335 [Gemmatimonadota bacterium]
MKSSPASVQELRQRALTDPVPGFGGSHRLVEGGRPLGRIARADRLERDDSLTCGLSLGGDRSFHPHQLGGRRRFLRERSLHARAATVEEGQLHGDAQVQG